MQITIFSLSILGVNCQGRISDGGVFKNTELHKKIESGKLNLPSPLPLPGKNVDLPFVIIADEAFA